MKNALRFFVALFAFSVFFNAAACAEAAPCGIGIPYEYCQIGCEGLGDFVVVPLSSAGAFVDRLLALDPLERISAFVLQPTNNSVAYVLIYRAKIGSSPASRGWQIEQAASIEDAGVIARIHDGNIASTNDPARPFVVIWLECAELSRDGGAR